MRAFLHSLTLRIIVLVFLVMCSMGLALHAFVLSSVSEFADRDISRQISRTAGDIFEVINTRFETLRGEGQLDDERAVRVQKGLALGDMERMLRDSKVACSVLDQSGGGILLDFGLPPGAKVAMQPSDFRTLVHHTVEGRDFYLYGFEFGPWNWRVILAADTALYEPLRDQVRQAYTAAAWALVAAMGILFLLLRASLRRPLTAIIEKVRRDNPPDYRGISEFEYLSDQIADMMGSLHEKTGFIRSLFESVAALIVVLDGQGRIIMLNRAAEQALGVSEDDASGRECHEILPEGCCLADAPGADPDAPEETTFMARGREMTVLWTRSVLTESDGTVACVIKSGLDITDRKQADRELRRQQAFFQQLFDRSPQAIVVVDSSDHVLRANQGFTDLFGYTETEALGEPINELIVPQDLMEEGERLSEDSLGGELVARESVRRTKDGQMIHVSILGVPILVDEAQVGVYGIYNDITARVMAENELKHQARHDFLTNLPNRSIFLERIKSALTRVARHENYNCAVLFLDLDKFKNINDTYGHKAGDELLVSLARRMQRCLRDIDTVARFGGDEFAVLIDDARELRRTIQVIERIMEETSKPFTLDGNEVLTGISIGVVPDIRGYESAGQVLSDADIALYRAKEGGRGRYEIFDSSMQDEATRMTQLENDLQAAMEREEFALNYQPIVHMSDGSVAGFEALLRWRHAQQGMMMPTSFLTTAEETGLIQQIDYWVMHTAGGLAKELRAAHPGRPVAMNVNLSPKNFYRADLVTQVRTVLEALQLGPDGLRLEIDEGLLMEDPGFSAGVLERLHKLEVGLVVDNFGVGVSCLPELHRFPVHMIKLHHEFVQTLTDRRVSREIARALITMATTLGVEVVAKGVETPDQRDALAAMGCPFAQGFLYHKPLPPEEATALLDQA